MPPRIVSRILPLLLGLLLVGCDPGLFVLDSASPAPAEDTAQPENVPDGPTVNVAALGRLGGTERIDIEKRDMDGNMELALVVSVEDPETIASIVDTLDAPLPLVPPVMCVDRYRLHFYLASGSALSLGLVCEGDDLILRGDVPFLQEQNARAPEALHTAIENAIAAAE